MRVATLDLGTNTFRLQISEKRAGSINKIYRETNITRLGEGLVTNGSFCKEAMDRSLSVLIKYKNIIEDHHVHKIYAAGTSAFRNAENGNDFAAMIHDETGIDVRIISGHSEAEMTVMGVIDSIEGSIDRFYHLDIGGGSTEISLINSGKIQFSVSMEMGVVHFAEDTKNLDNRISTLSEEITNTLTQKISNQLRENNKNIPLLATSGTPIVIACISEGATEFKPSLVNYKKLKIEEIDEIKDLLIKHSIDNELDKFGNILKGREDLIVPGALILIKTMKFLENDCMIISESGLLDGLIHMGN